MKQTIHTPYNPRPAKTEKRILRNGRWQRPDAKAHTVLNWLKN